MAEPSTPAPLMADLVARRSVRRKWMLSTPALIIIFIGAVGPLLVMPFYSVFEADSYGGVRAWTFSGDGWFKVLFKRDFLDGSVTFATQNLVILWRSIWLSVVTTLLTLLIGFPTAYFIATRNPRQREIWVLLLTIPFWTNLLIRTFAIQELLRAEGVFSAVLQWLGLADGPVQMLFTEGAILFGMVYVFLPLMVMPLYASMERIDFRLVEAGYDLYATRYRVLRRIIIPSVMPGVIAGSILVFIPSIGSYVVPRILGGGTTLMLGNQIDLQFGQGRNWPLGAALSITLMVLVVGAMAVWLRSRPPERGFDD